MAWDDGDDFFGGLFDINGDGVTDEEERALGFFILNEMSRDDDNGGDSGDND